MNITQQLQMIEESLKDNEAPKHITIELFVQGLIDEARDYMMNSSLGLI